MIRRILTGLFCITFTFSCDDADHVYVPYQKESFNYFPNENWEFDMVDDAGYQVVEEPVRASKKALKVILKPGDIVAGGNRAEIKTYPGHKPESHSWLKFSIWVPEKFRQSAKLRGSRHMIMQFHEQPPEGMGWQEFKTVKSRNRRPSVAINLTFYNEKTLLNLMYGNHRYSDGDTIRQSNIGKYEIERERWVDVKLHIKWSLKGNGFIESWINNKVWSGVVEGANMTNMTPVNLKLGLYRKPEYEYQTHVFFDEIAISQNESF